jgi:hypothetical protein
MTIGWLKVSGQSLKLTDDWAEALRMEAVVGGSASFVQGEFADYHRFFLESNEPNTVVSGGLRPIYSVALGARARYYPFADAPLSDLGVSVGISYLRRGFRNVQKFSVEDPDREVKDKGSYVESYRMNFISIPVILTYGQSWFGEIGFTVDRMINGSRKRKLRRRVSGEDAYDGGFRDTQNNIQSLDSQSVVDGKSTAFWLAGGKRFDSGMGLRLGMHLSGQSLISERNGNFKNATLMLQWIIPVGID